MTNKWSSAFVSFLNWRKAWLMLAFKKSSESKWKRILLCVAPHVHRMCRIVCATHSFAYSRRMNGNFISKEFTRFKLNCISVCECIVWMHLNIFVILWYISVIQSCAACIGVDNFQFILLDFFLHDAHDIGTLFTLNQFNHFVYIPTFNWHLFFEINMHSMNNKFCRSHSFVGQICIYLPENSFRFELYAFLHWWINYQ